MKKFSVSEHWTIGHEKIDREHEKLIGLLNQIIDCEESENVTLFRSTLDLFCVELGTHFRNESQIMHDLGYVEKGHDEEHGTVLRDLKNIEIEISKYNMHEKLGYLISVFVDKILKDDIYFAEYLVSINYKE